MLDQNTLIFLALGLFGLAVMIFGFKLTNIARKVVETIGAILFHVGLFGIIYLKVRLSLFISIIAFVTSLFILIDPLRLGQHLNKKIYKLFGFLALFIAIVFFLEFLTGFPVWLWILPIVLYLLPYLIPPLKKIAWFISLLSWILIFSYVGISGYVIYSHFHPEADKTIITKLFPQLKLKADIADEPDKIDQPDTEHKQKPAVQKTTPQPVVPPVVQTPPPTQPAPIIAPPEPQQTLQQQYDELKKKYDALVKESETLKKQ